MLKFCQGVEERFVAEAKRRLVIFEYNHAKLAKEAKISKESVDNFMSGRSCSKKTAEAIREALFIKEDD
jgi:hypothetical protein